MTLWEPNYCRASHCILEEGHDGQHQARNGYRWSRHPGNVLTYRWGNNARRAQLKGRLCVVIAKGTKGSVLLKFLDNGERVVSSWRAAW